MLTSGVPQGFGDDRLLLVGHVPLPAHLPVPVRPLPAGPGRRWPARRPMPSARTRRRGIAFAVGWMSHCATDVTGHAFTNAKSGGPYRTHWQRHHLVENHMDSENYGARHPGPLYGEYGTSALHFRLAFRHRDRRAVQRPRRRAGLRLLDRLPGVRQRRRPDRRRLTGRRSSTSTPARCPDHLTDGFSTRCTTSTARTAHTSSCRTRPSPPTDPGTRPARRPTQRRSDGTRCGRSSTAT